MKISRNFNFSSNRKENVDIPFYILDNNIFKNFKDLID